MKKTFHGLLLSFRKPKYSIRYIVFLLLSIVPSRWRQWFKILRRLRGATTSFEISLIFSAIIDSIAFSLFPNQLSPKSLFSGVVISKKFGCSWTVRAGTDDIYSIMPEREQDAHDLILSLLKPGDIFIDVGANIGYYTILASNIVKSDGAVIAFEPMAETFRCLETNCKLNRLRNVTLIPRAAWNNEGTMPITVRGGFYGMASMKEDKGNSVLVHTIPLDKVCQKYNRIQMVKIDAEGAEYEILRGAESTLNKVKYLVIECGSDYDRIVHMLENSNFSVRKLNFTSYILAENKEIRGIG